MRRVHKFAVSGHARADLRARVCRARRRPSEAACSFCQLGEINHLRTRHGSHRTCEDTVLRQCEDADGIGDMMLVGIDGANPCNLLSPVLKVSSTRSWTQLAKAYNMRNVMGRAMPGVRTVAMCLLLATPATCLGLGRRCVLGAAGAALIPQACSASYMMGQAAQQAQSWQPTGKEKEQAVYRSIEDALDEKRKFRDDAGTLGYVGGEYTQYRRGGAREQWEKDHLNKDSSDVSAYARAEDLVIAARARSIANP